MFLGDGVPLAQENSARLVNARLGRMRFHLTLELRLERAIVTRRFLIKNDQVRTESTESPVGVRQQQFGEPGAGDAVPRRQPTEWGGRPRSRRSREPIARAGCEAICPRRAAAASSDTAGNLPAPGNDGRRRRRCPGIETRVVLGSTPFRRRVSRFPDVDTSRPVQAQPRVTVRRGVMKSSSMRSRGCSVAAQRKLKIGSSTAPTEPERSRRSASGSAVSPARARNTARSVSCWTGPVAPTRMWAAQIGGSSSARSRRRASSTPSEGCSVSMNSLANAGWKASVRCGASANSR